MTHLLRAMSGVVARLGGNRKSHSRMPHAGRIGLAGQHGFVFKPPGALRWQCLLDDFDAEVGTTRVLSCRYSCFLNCHLLWLNL